MSHLTSFKNKTLINTEDCLLQKSFEEIGLQIDFDKKKIETQSWSWKVANVDAVLMQDGKELPIGLKFSRTSNGDKEVEIIGDFWGTGLNQEQVTNKLAQFYQKNHIIKKCEEQGWYVDQDTIKEVDGELVFQAEKWA